MSSFGKVSRSYLHRVIYTRLGSSRREVLVGPQFGVDNAVLRIGKGRVLVATADPLSFIPELGPRDSAWLSVNLLASDLTTSGFLPQYGLFDFNLPPTMTDSDFARYWRSVHHECSQLGLAIVGGHTGRYEGCDYTIIGGGVLFTIGSEESYLTSAMAQSGDDIIITKGAAVETTAVLTRVFPRTVRRVLGTNLFEKAWNYLPKVSTVKEALTAGSVGQYRDVVSGMHDATEGGVLAAILELATAARLGVEVDMESIPISQETEGVCKLFGVDPLTALSEGSLVVACKPEKTSSLLKRLRSERIKSEVVGRLTEQTGVAVGTSKRGRVRLRYPRFDPYWRAFWRARKKGWT